MTPMFMLIPGYADIVSSAGLSVLVANPAINHNGGVIVNPLDPFHQGIYAGAAESLFVNLLGTATPNLTAPGTIELVPGQWFQVPKNTSVWVSARTAGHKFTAFFSSQYKVPYPPTIVPGQPTGPITGGSDEVAIGAEPGSIPFPPPNVTGLQTVIPSYLYQQYTDDDDCQGFVDSQNIMQQDFVDTFNALNLPIYTGPIVQGLLLDWVGRGLYGMSRPALGQGYFNLYGPLNTWGCNFLGPPWFIYDNTMQVTFGLNEIGLFGPFQVYLTDDDTYRRILTWHFFKADTKYCDIRWLKRRIWRFLYCMDGKSTDWAWDPMVGGPHPSGVADPDDAFIADTFQISVLFGPDRNCTIRFVLNDRTVNQPTGGHMANCFGPNGFEVAFGKPLRPPVTDDNGGIWDIGVDKTPSGGGVNWQFDSYKASATGTSVAGTSYINLTSVVGTITNNCSIHGSGIPDGVTIVDQVSGTIGGAGQYLTSMQINISSTSLWFGTGIWEEVGGGGASVSPGGIYINHIETSYQRLPPMPFMNIFKQALDLGVLEMPYQFNFTCTIG
jgi:hypothetical protein